jgi:hypothetical protein
LNRTTLVLQETKLAMRLVTEKIPDQWVDKALDMPTPKQAWNWLLRKFTGGQNGELMVRWEALFRFWADPERTNLSFVFSDEVSNCWRATKLTNAQSQIQALRRGF